MKCPICERANPPHAPYCQNCGADLNDPDVLAQAGAGPTLTAPGAEASLASDSFFGVSGAGLVDGRHLGRLAWIGGAIVIAAFLVPIDPDWDGLRMSWSLLGEGRSVALILPLLLGAAALELAVLGGRVPQLARAGLLVAFGAALFAFAIVPVAEGAGAPLSPPWLVWGGTLIAAIGATARILRPIDRNARWVIAGGAALVLLGFLLPVSDTRPNLPMEFSLFQLDGKLMDTNYLHANTVGVGAQLLIRFMSLWQLAVIPALAGAFLLALRRPSGPWDTKATGLRPLTWVICVFLPLTFGLGMLNIAGSPYTAVVWQERVIDIDVFTHALFAGRARLLLVTLGASAWLIGGGTALYLKLVPPGAAATDAPTKSA